MSYSTSLNKVPWIIRVGTSTVAILQRTLQGWKGELATDENGRLWTCNATESPFEPIKTLDIAIVNNGEVVCHDDEIVWSV